MENLTDAEAIRVKLEQCREERRQQKKTMSVPEMREMLGLKKTGSYWLVHRNFFKTEVIGGKMRIDIDSFEKWYANQVKHKKVNGEEPGSELIKTSYSFREAADLLGVHDSYLYDIWRDNNLETITVDYVKRIPIEVFEKWYDGQNVYRKFSRIPDQPEIKEHYITLNEAALLLGISKEMAASITRKPEYKNILEVVIFQNRKWISKRSFEYFLSVQDKYKLVDQANDSSENKTEGMEIREYLTRAQAASLAGVTESTITRWMQMQYFPCVGAGKVLRIRRKDFLDWLTKYQEGDE